jgi:Tfp pilus assembly protein PilF
MLEGRIKSNPYDWEHEITTPGLFAGRAEEIKRVDQELARLLPTPFISPKIAIVGKRRVGKTSLLWRIKEECGKYPFLGVIITLSHRNVALDPWEFWRLVFQQTREEISKLGLVGKQGGEEGTGFRADRQDDTDLLNRYFERQRFDRAYGDQIGKPRTIVLDYQLLLSDLELLCAGIMSHGYEGIVLLIDEADLLVQSYEITQLLRQVSASVRFGILLAGEADTARLFTEPSQRLYLQGIVMPLENFRSNADVAECALLPLDEGERQLMSPMTVNYLSRLSQGKPNQIRLICNSIYNMYMDEKRKDLNITIDVMEDVVDRIESTYPLGQQIEAIRRLNSVELESLYNLTRYPDWRVQDVINLDESFRGEARSAAAEKRRLEMINRKRQGFIEKGIMEDSPDRLSLVGGEFMYLYIRFWYELRKYGELLKKVDLRNEPTTLFGEKVDKLISSLCYELDRHADIRVTHTIPHDTQLGEIVLSIRKRFKVLSQILRKEFGFDEDVRQQISECFQLCELVSKPGPYNLIFLTVRNLDNPRELEQVELYCPGESLLMLPTAAVTSIVTQSKQANLLIEGLETFPIALTDLKGLFEAIGAPSLEDFIRNLDSIQKWYVSSVQHLLKAEGSETPQPEGDLTAREKELYKYLDLYAKDDLEGAELHISQKLGETSSGRELSKLYNDRGYIRHGLKKVTEAEQDFETALRLHYAYLPLTLLNMAIIKVDGGAYEEARQLIEDALFLTYQRANIAAAYLRFRLPETHLGYFGSKQRWEQRPANVLEVAYINLAYISLVTEGYQPAQDVLSEGLSLIPSSFRLKHAMARVHLSQKNATLADPYYQELYDALAQQGLTDRFLRQEVESYGKRFLKRKKAER